MGCKCGSQIILCNLPVRFDTYRGCSHGCRYCFAQKKNDISHIERDESVDGLMQEELAKKTDYHRKVFGLDE